jgi:Uma2 family endonuclease
MKVRVAERRFFYPDVSVGCAAADRRDGADWIAVPRLIVEVLADATAAYDRGAKFAAYRQVAAPRDDVLVETERRRVEGHSRRDEGPWTLVADGPGEVVSLPGLGAPAGPLVASQL